MPRFTFRQARGLRVNLDTHRVTSDAPATPRRKSAIRSHERCLTFVFPVLAGIGLFVAPAFADLRRATAEVILVCERNVYVALRDSLPPLRNDRVIFRRRKETLATGLVNSTLNGELAVVLVISGSMAKVRKLAKVEVWFERSQMPPRPVLRVGYPATSRANLLFACDNLDLAFALPSGAYRAGPTTVRSSTWIRDPALPLSRPWPDTLIARFFEDATDEEIALERGELDVAIFWPGELSRHMREQSRWQTHSFGMYEWGFLGAEADSSPGDPATDPALTALNRELFADDLRYVIQTKAPLGPVRYEVDLACPGWRQMQRLLDRYASTTTRRVRLAFVERDSTSGNGAEPDGIVPLFILRCPMVCREELEPYLDALDRSTLVNALKCQVRKRTR